MLLLLLLLALTDNGDLDGLTAGVAGFDGVVVTDDGEEGDALGGTGTVLEGTVLGGGNGGD